MLELSRTCISEANVSHPARHQCDDPVNSPPRPRRKPAISAHNAVARASSAPDGSQIELCATPQEHHRHPTRALAWISLQVTTCHDQDESAERIITRCQSNLSIQRQGMTTPPLAQPRSSTP